MAIDRKTQETYSAVADAYDAHVMNPADSPLHAFYEKPAMHAELPELTGLKVLSLGCGSGGDAQWIMDNGAESVYGADISAGLIDIARCNYPEVGFQVMDMSQLGFRDESFDLVCSSLAIHYLASWKEPLEEARRVLKPGGQFIFSCNHPLETSLEYSVGSDTRGAYLGRTIIQGTNERRIHGDYLAVDYDGVKQIEGTIADNYAVHYYHRPFSSMIKSIVASGFTIQKLVEPIPLPAMKVNNAEHYKQVMQLPKFAVWVLEK